jgi:hypothetical protein
VIYVCRNFAGACSPEISNTIRQDCKTIRRECVQLVDKPQSYNFIPVTMAANGVISGTAPSGATDAVLKPSDPVPDSAIPVQGLDFDNFTDRNVTVAELVEGMANMGFQASSIGQAVEIVNGMVCK